MVYHVIPLLSISISTDRCIDSIDIPGTHEPTVFVVHFCMLNASSGSLKPVPTFPRLIFETSIFSNRFQVFPLDWPRGDELCSKNRVQHAWKHRDFFLD